MSQAELYASHLIELRSRILRTFVIYVAICSPCIYFAKDLYQYLSKPLTSLLPEGSALIATQVTTTFTVPLKLALIFSFLIILPFLLYQLWQFIAPGLYQNEKKLFFPLLILSVLLFYVGGLFAYFVVCPIALKFFVSMAPPGVQVMTDIQHYYNFIAKFLISFGFAFEVPIFTFFAIRSGITSIENLKGKRPYIIVAAFIIGMLLTPPDVISQVLLAVPLLLLFELGLLLAKWKR